MCLWIGCILMDSSMFENKEAIAVYLALLGFKVEWSGLDNLPEDKHVLVSNHVSVGDLMILFEHFQQSKRYSHIITSAIPSQAFRTKHLPVTLLAATADMYEELERRMDHNDAPIHLFPEGGMTNGSGMMRFSRGFLKFAHSLPVVPVALKLHTPFDIRTHTLNSGFLANLFWLSFCPWVRAEVTALPAMRLAPTEKKAAFVQRLQQAIADHLGQPVHPLTIKQKKQMMQRRR